MTTKKPKAKLTKKVTKKPKDKEGVKKTIKKIQKNISQLPAVEDVSELDSAVSELAKQTEALLGKSGEKMRKPTLPKKAEKNIPHSNGVSFDIIHDGTKSSVTPAILKSPHPGQKLLEPSDGDDGDNIKVKISNKTDANEDTSKAEPAIAVGQSIVTTHKAGSLHSKSTGSVDAADSDSPDGEVQAKDKADVNDGEQDKVTVTIKSKSAQPAKPTIDATDQSDDGDDAESTLKKPADNSESEDTSDESTDGARSGVQDDTKQQPTQTAAKPITMATDPTQSMQIYSDNLDKKTDDKDGNEEESDSDDPLIFDTDEYHPTLHDWSKLDRHSRGPVLILLLLMVLLAAIVYVVVSGIEIPFINY